MRRSLGWKILFGNVHSRDCFVFNDYDDCRKYGYYYE